MSPQSIQAKFNEKFGASIGPNQFGISTKLLGSISNGEVYVSIIGNKIEYCYEFAQAGNKNCSTTGTLKITYEKNTRPPSAPSAAAARAPSAPLLSDRGRIVTGVVVAACIIGIIVVIAMSSPTGGTAAIAPGMLMFQTIMKYTS